MPEKYQPSQEEWDKQNEHFVVPIQEPAGKPQILQQETKEIPFDQKTYDQWIRNNAGLAEIISRLNAGVDPNIIEEMNDELGAFCNAVVRDMHIAEQALVRAESRRSAMQWLRELIEQAQDNPDFFTNYKKHMFGQEIRLENILIQ